jgi:hypothetical protein
VEHGSSACSTLNKGRLLLPFQSLSNRLDLSEVIRIVIGEYQCLAQKSVSIAVRDLCQ